MKQVKFYLTDKRYKMFEDVLKRAYNTKSDLNDISEHIVSKAAADFLKKEADEAIKALNS